MAENDKKMTEIGALWVRISKANKKYITGKLEIGDKVINLVGFSNQYKEGKEERPDYRLYLDEGRSGNTSNKNSSPKKTFAKKASTPAPVQESEAENLEI